MESECSADFKCVTLGDHGSSWTDEDFKTSSKTDGVVWCVAVKRDTNNVSVRDTKNGRELDFTPGEWRAFIEGVKAGEFDLD